MTERPLCPSKTRLQSVLSTAGQLTHTLPWLSRKMTYTGWKQVRIAVAHACPLHDHAIVDEYTKHRSEACDLANAWQPGFGTVQTAEESILLARSTEL